MNRQVRMRGCVERVEAAAADACFATRPRLAQIGAWASKQSAPLESRMAFEKAVAREMARYAVGTVPRPPYWSGYRLVPPAREVLQEPPDPPHSPLELPPGEPGAAWGETT